MEIVCCSWWSLLIPIFMSSWVYECGGNSLTVESSQGKREIGAKRATESYTRIPPKTYASSPLMKYYDKPRSRADLKIGNKPSSEDGQSKGERSDDNQQGLSATFDYSILDPRTFILGPLLAAPLVFGSPALLAAPSLFFLPLVIAPLVLILIIMLV